MMKNILVECIVREAPKNGGSNPRVGGSVSVDDRVTYFCDDGFDLRGSRSATCEENGDFSNEPPTCVESKACRQWTLI